MSFNATLTSATSSTPSAISLQESILRWLSAGLQGKVKIMGQLPGLENLENLKSGEDAMWLPELLPLIGWRVIDAFARHFVGDDAEIAADGSPTPTQVLTEDNVSGAVYDPSGYWVGVEDYESRFEGLWDVQ